MECIVNYIPEKNKKSVSFIFFILSVFFIIIGIVFLIRFNYIKDTTDYLSLTLFGIFLIVGFLSFSFCVLLSNICGNIDMFNYQREKEFNTVMNKDYIK